MPYSTRNALYLRISSWTVLPLYLYLDERHVGWMNDATLQAALADLRPKLLAKFHAEDPNLTKKSTVEVHRGASYQFAFFFRKTDTRHVVLLKRREYVPQATRRPQSLAIPPKPNLQDPTDLPSRRPKATPKRKANDDTYSTTDMRRSTRARSEVNYAQDMGSPSPPLREEDGLMSPLRDENEPQAQPALFLDGGDDDTLRAAPTSPLIQVKDEPQDLVPMGIPARSEAEKEEMYAGARESMGRTAMDTGYEDAGDGLAEGGEREGSEELLTFRPVVDDEAEEKKDSKVDVKPQMKLSYKGFSISSRHLVLIIEPYPPLTAAPKPSARARSTYASRSMSRATESRARGPMSTFAQGFESERDQATPLIPNSRSGGTSTPSAFQSAATPAPSMRSGGAMGGGQTPIPNSRSGGRTGSAAPLPFRMSATPASARNGAAGTPLFRDMTPMSEFGGVGDGESLRNGGRALFDDEEGSSEEEDKEWRRRTRGSSYAPWRGTSVIGGQETSRPTAPARDAPVSDSDESDSVGRDDDDLPSSDDEDAQEIAQARRLMALSQRLQENTSGREGAGAMSGAGRVVDAGELGGGIGDDDAFGDGDEGGQGEFGRDDVGGADA